MHRIDGDIRENNRLTALKLNFFKKIIDEKKKNISS